MTLSLGRIVFTDPRVSVWEQSVETVRLALTVTSSSLDEATAVRDQLLGLGDNPDEPVIPVVWTDNPRVTGYYRPGEVSASAVLIANPSFIFTYTVSLGRVIGFTAPAIESVMVGAVRTNTHSITAATTRTWHAFPATATYYAPGAFSALGLIQRDSADGLVYLNIEGGDGASYYDTVAQWAVPPDSYYVGAATIETGSTLRKIVGRQTINTPTLWRLSNGIVRITQGTGGNSRFDVSWHNGTTWSAAKTFRLYATAAGPSNGMLGGVQSVTVLRNSPELCALRFVISDSALPSYFFTIDVALRRGARLAEMTISQRGTGSGTSLTIARDVTEAATALTGGIRATSTDGAGGQYVFATPTGFGSDLTNGSISMTAVVIPWSLAIGFHYPASGETAQDLVYEYVAAVSERQVLIER